MSTFSRVYKLYTFGGSGGGSVKINICCKSEKWCPFIRCKTQLQSKRTLSTLHLICFLRERSFNAGWGVGENSGEVEYFWGQGEGIYLSDYEGGLIFVLGRGHLILDGKIGVGSGILFKPRRGIYCSDSEEGLIFVLSGGYLILDRESGKIGVGEWNIF